MVKNLGTWIQSLVQEDSTRLRATNSVSCNNRAGALETVLHNKRSHCNEKKICTATKSSVHLSQQEKICEQK